MLNRNCQKKQPSSLLLNNDYIDDKQLIADAFNDFFLFYIGPSLIPSIERNCASFLKDRNTKHSIFFVSTHSVEIKHIIRNFENKPSSGHDGISYTVLNNIVHEILVPLEHVFNLSLVNGVAPRNIAKAIFLFSKKETL